MQLKFADRITGLSASAIREILKFSSMPGFISFAAGSPADEAFPSKQIADIIYNAILSSPNSALNYSVTEGYTPLREFMKDYLKNTHLIGDENDDLIITSGAQQIMDLVCKTLCNEGDCIICENPSFIGALNAYRSYGVKLIGIDMKNDGMDTEQLEKALKENKNVKLIYTIPNFQNPTGLCKRLKKRKQIYSLAKKYQVLIIEDNPYGDIRFEGENIKDIKTLDDENLVIYAGTFSKVLAPGLRVGYCLADKRIIQKIVICKQTSDVHSTVISQIAAYEFIKDKNFGTHLESIREIYKKKAHFTMNLIDEKLSDYLTYNKIEGGLFIWCKLNDIDMESFCKECAKNLVGVVPGSAFSINGEKSDSFRINYSSPSEDDIVKGINILAKVANTF